MGVFLKDDLLYVLKGAYEKKSRNESHTRNVTEDCIHKMYKYLHPTQSEDLINIFDNLSGTRLLAEMKKIIPGVLPSTSSDRFVKRMYKRKFQAILLPTRTATGWFIEPSRLLDILMFQYPFLTCELHIRLWGMVEKLGVATALFLVCLS